MKPPREKAGPAEEGASDDLRIDKWLWHVRLFKTRTLASEACRTGHVRLDDEPVKPAQRVRIGARVSVRQGIVTRTLRVAGLPVRRVGAKEAGRYAEDRTPPEEYEKLRELKNQSVLVRARGAGRPTKRDRRAIEKLMRGMGRPYADADSE